MSNTARKARKKSGEKFVHKAKAGTPLEYRALRPSSMENQMKPFGRRHSARHTKKIEDAIKIRDMDVILTQKGTDNTVRVRRDELEA